MKNSLDLVFKTGEDTRAVRMVLRDGQPWFALVDVCTAIGINNVTDTAKRVDEDDLDSIEVIDSLGRTQVVRGVNEAGLYQVILGARPSERTKAFKLWVTREVLPTIRKTGSYSVEPQLEIRVPTTGEMFVQSAELIVSLERRADAIEDRAAAIEAELALTTINSLEVKQISDSARAVARLIGKKYHLVWGEFNKHFNLASYRDLPRVKFLDALGWLRTWHDDVLRENNTAFLGQRAAPRGSVQP